MYYDLIESGKRIRGLREAKGYTQEELAEVFNTSLDYIVGGKKDNQILNHMLDELDESKQELALRILKGILENI